MFFKYLPVMATIKRGLLAVSFLFFAHQSFAFDVSINASGKTVSVFSNDAEVKYLSFTAWNMSGQEVFAKTSNGSKVVWMVESNIADGNYKYEVILSNVAAGSRSRGDVADKVEVSSATHTGAVYIQAGAIVSPSEEEVGVQQRLQRAFGIAALSVLNFIIPEAHADIVQNDDVISTQSQCIGNDCVNGENFGFDTLRLKENNLRIHFDDTSTSASFPSNDWRITINDSNNGGNNFFGIDDATSGRGVFRIEGGAPSNSFYVSSQGNLGVGTSNPITTIEAASGNTPALRLNQNGSSGFFPQVWDLGGNESGFFLRDATNGSALPFRVRTGAPTDSLVVNSSGNVGIGIDNPSQKLHVVGNAIVSGNLEVGSSRAIKNQIKDLGLEQAMMAFDALEPVLFRYNHSPDEQAIGFIAEDVPDLVATQSRKSLKPMDIIALLTKVVQEQQKTIDDLSGKIDGLMSEKTNQELDR